MSPEVVNQLSTHEFKRYLELTAEYKKNEREAEDKKFSILMKTIVKLGGRR